MIEQNVIYYIIQNFHQYFGYKSQDKKIEMNLKKWYISMYILDTRCRHK